MESPELAAVTTGPTRPVRHAMRVLLAEFRERVLIDPDKPAVVDATQTLTYAELDAWSSSMAHGLLAAPPTAQPVVAIVSWLGLEAIALHQAVLKAGLVLAPLDPREPDEVLLASAERLGARMVLVDGERAASLTPSGPRSAITTPADLDSGVTTPPDGSFDPTRPIFLGATSGSTERSRSVVFPSSLTDLMNEMRLVRSAEARVGIFLPPMFVAANAPVTSAWRSGATAYCYDLSQQPMADLPSWMERVGLTAFALTPSLVRMMIEPWLEQGRPLPDVTHVTLTGETLTGHDVRVLRRVLPNATFVNVYGAADAALVSRFEIPPDLEVPDGPVSVGKPLRPIEILDDEGEPLPPGEVGIITAVGDWLPMVLDLEGPLDLAVLDLDRVRRAPTGDLGRLLPDGTLELLGRADHRVKVRGQMVDPNRVEAALVGLDEVQDAVVSAVARDGTTALVAHVVPSVDPAPRARELRRALRADLPSFMVPSTFVVVSDLPRLATGKADRRALREAAATVVPERPQSAPPSGGTEEIVAGIFAELLELDAVGRDDDFFDLGGDSLSAIELMTAIEQALGLAVDSSAIVEDPTVAGLAGWITQRRRPGSARLGPMRARLRPRVGRDDGRRIATLRSEGAGLPLYVVPGGGNNVFQMQPLAAALHDRAVHELVPKGLDARTWPNYSVESMARRHVESMESVRGPFVLAGYSFGGLVAWEMARELTAAGRPPACLVLLDPSGFADREGLAGWVGARVRFLAGRAAARGREAASAAHAGGVEVGSARPDPAQHNSAHSAASAGAGGLRSVGPMIRAMAPRALRVGLSEPRRIYRLWVPPLTLGMVRRDLEVESRLFMDVSRYASRRYVPKPFGGPVVFVASTERVTTRPGELASVRALGTGEITELVVPGDHLGILRPPHVRGLAAQLDGVLPSG